MASQAGRHAPICITPLAVQKDSGRRGLCSAVQTDFFAEILSRERISALFQRAAVNCILRRPSGKVPRNSSSSGRIAIGEAESDNLPVTADKTITALILATSIIFLLLVPAPSKNIKTIYETGLDLYNHRQFRLSMRAFQDVLQSEPKFAAALIMKGRCHLKLDEPQLAVADFDKAIGLNATSAEAFLYRAEAYCNLEQNSRALVDCSRSLSLKPSQRGYQLRGKLYLLTGNAQKAVADLGQAIKLGPLEAGMLLDRAEALAKEKQYQLCVLDCTRALALPSIDNQDIVRAYRDRASAYDQMGKKDLALKDRESIQAKAIFEWGQP